MTWNGRSAFKCRISPYRRQHDQIGNKQRNQTGRGFYLRLSWLSSSSQGHFWQVGIRTPQFKRGRFNISGPRKIERKEALSSESDHDIKIIRHLLAIIVVIILAVIFGPIAIPLIFWCFILALGLAVETYSCAQATAINLFQNPTPNTLLNAVIFFLALLVIVFSMFRGRAVARNKSKNRC
jgi:hypothetical protein